MEKLELGKSYDAEELAKICGKKEDIRYDYHAFVGHSGDPLQHVRARDDVAIRNDALACIDRCQFGLWGVAVAPQRRANIRDVQGGSVCPQRT